MILFTIAEVIVANLLIGAIILDCIDTEDEALYRWFDSCPRELAWFLQPLILTVWPGFLLLWLRLKIMDWRG